MSQGKGNRFDILKQSPLDLRPPQCQESVDTDEVRRWIPSRYNFRVIGEDGRMILWNTYRRTMTIFEAEHRSTIESLLSRSSFEAPSEGTIKYLLDRGFLVKNDTDEYRRFQLAFGQQHYRTDTLTLTLLASEDCNFRCRYCYEEYTRGTMQPWVRSGIKNLIHKRLSGLRALSIIWFGGEPLYGLQAIEDLAPFFAEIAENHSLHLSNSIATNGYLLSPDVVEKLLAWRITDYQVTIDGPPEIHDYSRPTRDGQGTFSTILENLKALRGRTEDYLVNIRVNFDQKSSKYLGRLLDLLAPEFRGDQRFRISFRPVSRLGSCNDEELEVHGGADSRKIRMALANQAREKGMNLTEELRGINLGDIGVCKAARPFSFAIGASGKVMKCTVELDKDQRNIVGQLTEDGKLQLDRDNLALWTEPAFERREKCQRCTLLPVCQGVGCPLARFKRGRPRCATERLDIKQELKRLMEFVKDDGRKVVIGEIQSHQVPGASKVPLAARGEE